jgi:ADP-heptose:LPS heptosyltransferase
MACSGQAKAKTLAIFPGALGDFICFLPALGRLSTFGPIHLLAKPEFRELLPSWITVEWIERREMALAFVESADPDPALREFLKPFGAIYSWMGGADANYRRNLRAASTAAVSCFPFRPKTTRVHISDYYLSCVGETRAGGVPSLLFPAPEAVVWAQEYWSRRGLDGQEVLGVAPGSGAKEKNWPVERFKKVIEWWRRERGEAIVFTGPVEEDSGLAGRFRQELPHLRGAQLGRLAALLARCSLYTGNDSGLTHLAAALGVRTLAIFGPTNPVEWRPRGANVNVLSLNAACSPCDPGAMKVCPHRMCLNDLSPQEVITSLQKMSRSRGAGSRVDLDNI